MSNSLSIAAVTEAFRSLLEDAVAESGVSGAIATKVRPTPLTNIGTPGGLPASGVNVYLYQVSPNAAFRNTDLPTRRQDGSVIQPSRSAYDLSYLLSFYGDENRFEPQMVMGSVVRKLHAEPILTSERVKDAGNALKLVYPSLIPNLETEVERVKLSLMPLALEELSKLWSVFFQTAYSLSLTCQASVVFVDGTEDAKPGLPVRSRNIYVRTFRNPVIDAILSQKSSLDPVLTDQPIVFGDILVLAGKQLRGEVTTVRLDGMEVDPLDVSDTQIKILLKEPPLLADSLQAGIHSVQVLQGLLMGTPATVHKGFESNASAFILRPSITVTNTPVATTVDGQGVTWYETDLIIQFEPKVSVNQHVLLLLNEFNPPSNRPAHAHQYDITPNPLPPAPPLSSITAHVALSTPADFLVRVQVDGAESVLDMGPDPLHPLYSAPKVTIA
ncbi:MAG: DUF4255 domain-containing protein [Anaerolineae bacterium]|nr:DUF4255 domain-containing protein [Anaerolineae bacterium]